MQREFTVEREEEGMRLDLFLVKSCPELTRSFLQRLVKSQLVEVNGGPEKSGYKVRTADRICFEAPRAAEPEIEAEEIPLDIVYEDSDIILINKPKGMVVHPAAGHLSGTLVNALMYHCRGGLSGINGVLRPGIVHRIDRDTTGVLIVCKNDLAHNLVAAQLKEHSITRRYFAIVHGVLKEEEGTVDAPVGRHPTDRKKMSVHCKNGKAAVTHYKVLEHFAGFTFIECRLETGRTHQIRVHMASIGHPLLGDEVYGPARCPVKLQGQPLQGQTLHAGILGLRHPRTGEYMEFFAPLPMYFEELLEKLRTSGL